MHKCSEVQQIIQAHRLNKMFQEMREIQHYKNLGAYLMQCDECQQLWVVEEFDKDQDMIAAKVREAFSENKITALLAESHLKKLVHECGGHSIEKCAWINCENLALKEKRVCEYHHQK